MDRRSFIQATAACLIAPVIPQVLPEPVLPTPIFIKKEELRDLSCYTLNGTLYLSPEALEDIKAWVVDQTDEKTRREIYVSFDNES